MFVVLSVFRVAQESASDLATLYRNREHLVDHFEGFVSSEAFRNEDDPTEFSLMTRWRDRQSYELYRRSAAFEQSRQRMLEMMNQVRVQPGSHAVKYMEYIAG
jgi:heme-degrading monooxygenase HmoA